MTHALSSLTLVLVMLPGAQLHSFRRGWTGDKWRPAWLLACLAFPLTLIVFKGALLFSQSPRLIGMNIRLTACEIASESILQLSLQLFIIFQRSKHLPSKLQAPPPPPSTQLPSRFKPTASPAVSCHAPPPPPPPSTQLPSRFKPTAMSAES